MAGQCDFCYRISPSRGVYERKVLTEKREKHIFCLTSSKKCCIFKIVDCRILIQYTGTIFQILEVFKEFVLDLMLEAIDILSRF